MNEKPVLVTTSHRGVFFGYLEDSEDECSKVLRLKKVRMAIYWNTKGGLLELAEKGPNSGSKISNEAPRGVLQDVTAVWELTEEAVTAWKSI